MISFAIKTGLCCLIVWSSHHARFWMGDMMIVKDLASQPR